MLKGRNFRTDYKGFDSWSIGRGYRKVNRAGMWALGLVTNTFVPWVRSLGFPWLAQALLCFLRPSLFKILKMRVFWEPVGKLKIQFLSTVFGYCRAWPEKRWRRRRRRNMNTLALSHVCTHSGAQHLPRRCVLPDDYSTFWWAQDHENITKCTCTNLTGRDKSLNVCNLLIPSKDTINMRHVLPLPVANSTVTCSKCPS